jgi:hypothetical protein
MDWSEWEIKGEKNVIDEGEHMLQQTYTHTFLHVKGEARK